jgi:hypothetical protein
MEAYIKSFINTGHGAEPARNFPVYLPSNISIITGYYAEDSTLIDVSVDVNINVMDAPSPQGWKVDPFNINYFYLYETGSYSFEIIYTDGFGKSYTYYISTVVINPITVPSQDDIYNLIKRNEPQGVYTQLQTTTDEEGNIITSNDYVDVSATASVFSNLYSDTKKVYDNLLPSGGSVNWEITLNNTSGLLSNQPFSDIILSMLYSLLVNNSGNRYDVSYFLSKYIWYRSNQTISCYVYIKEVTADNYLFWILGESLLGSSTFLNTSSLTPYQVGVYFIPQGTTIPLNLQEELSTLVKRVLPYGYTYFSYFNKTLADLGLVEFLPQIYKFDPRLIDFAIGFYSKNVEQARAYINPVGPGTLVSLSMTPPSGTNFTARNSYNYTITGTYKDGSTRDLTNSTVLFSSDVDVLSVKSLGVLYAVGNGSATIKFSNGLIFGINYYTVSSLGTWILNKSALNYTTILGGSTTPNWVLNLGELGITTTLS